MVTTRRPKIDSSLSGFGWFEKVSLTDEIKGQRFSRLGEDSFFLIKTRMVTRRRVPSS
jgi:hypothetical protein